MCDGDATVCTSVRINLCDDMETCQCKSDDYMSNGVCYRERRDYRH